MEHKMVRFSFASALLLAVGAAVKVKYDSYGTQRGQEKVALVRSINWDKLNVTCANGRWGDYTQGLSITVLIDGRQQRMGFHHELMNNTINPTFQSLEGYASWQYVSSIAPAPHPLDESWVTDYKDAFEYLAKKRTYKRLDDESIIKLIDFWKGVGQKMTSTIS